MFFYYVTAKVIRAPLVLLCLMASFFIPVNYLGAKINQIYQESPPESIQCACVIVPNMVTSTKLETYSGGHIYCSIKVTSAETVLWDFAPMFKGVYSLDSGVVDFTANRLCSHLALRERASRP